MSPRHTTPGTLSRGVFVVVVLVSLAVLFAPPSGVPSSPPGVDKIVHATLFAALTSTARWAGTGRLVTIGVMIGYAGISEVLQGTALVGRSASVADWLADVTGVLIGLVAWRLVARRSVTR